MVFTPIKKVHDLNMTIIKPSGCTHVSGLQSYNSVSFNGTITNTTHYRCANPIAYTFILSVKFTNATGNYNFNLSRTIIIQAISGGGGGGSGGGVTPTFELIPEVLNQRATPTPTGIVDYQLSVKNNGIAFLGIATFELTGDTDGWCSLVNSTYASYTYPPMSTTTRILIQCQIPGSALNSSRVFKEKICVTEPTTSAKDCSTIEIVPTRVVSSQGGGFNLVALAIQYWWALATLIFFLILLLLVRRKNSKKYNRYR